MLSGGSLIFLGFIFKLWSIEYKDDRIIEESILEAFDID